MLVEQFHLGENSSYTSLSSYGVTVGMDPRNDGFLLFVPTSAGRSLCYFSLLHVEDITPRQGPAEMLGFLLHVSTSPLGYNMIFSTYSEKNN